MVTKEEWDSYYEKLIQEKNVPGNLYKFRRWHCGHDNAVLTPKDCRYCRRQRQILTDPAVWFASAASFNDPYDSKLPFRWDQMQPGELRKRLLDLYRHRNPGLDDAKLQELVHYELANNPVLSSDENVRNNAWDRYSESVASSYGILSLAGQYEHTLLWSHYSDSHRGFCVELDARLLASGLFDLSRTDEEFVDIFKVAYSDSLPLILPSSDLDEDWLRHTSLMTTKSSVWEYEREWRFIWIGKTKFPRFIDKKTIRRVILGCRMPETHRREIIDVVCGSLPYTEVWEVVRSHTEFRLEFRPVPT